MDTTILGRPAIVRHENELAHADAVEYGRVLAKNWEGGLLVARSAEDGKSSSLFGGDFSPPRGKMSLRAFGEKAGGVDHKTVKKYLIAWDMAAEDGLVPAADTLSPGDAVDLSHLDAKTWGAYYSGKQPDTMSSTSDEWYTPAEYVEAARVALGGIDLDPASSAEANETVGAKVFWTKDDDSLSREWSGRVFLNPPFSLSSSFVPKLIEEYDSGRVTAAVLVLNGNRFDAKWFHVLWDYVLCFTDHRPPFRNPFKAYNERPTGGAAFVYLGPDATRFDEQFARFGAIVERRKG